MSHRNSDFDPTHVLVTDAENTTDEIHATNAAIDAVLDHADTVDLWIDEDLLGNDHPALVDKLHETFVRVQDEHFQGRSDDVRTILSEFLSETGTSIHRFVSLERLELTRNDACLLYHVPDHHRCVIDTSISSAVEPAVRHAIEPESAMLLPSRTLAEWYSDRTRYELSPPNFCISPSRRFIDIAGCYTLTDISRVHVDDERREIRIEWDEPSGFASTALGISVQTDQPDSSSIQSTDSKTLRARSRNSGPNWTGKTVPTIT